MLNLQKEEGKTLQEFDKLSILLGSTSEKVSTCDTAQILGNNLNMTATYLQK